MDIEPGPVPDDGSTARLRITPDPFGMGEPRSGWRGDLNADGLPDLILVFSDACGNWGECPYGVFVGCGGTRYATVREPDYVVDLRVGSQQTQVAGSDWLELIELLRAGSVDEPRVDMRTLRFDGTRYRAVSAAAPHE